MAKRDRVQAVVKGRTFVVFLFLNHGDKKGFSTSFKRRNDKYPHDLKGLAETAELGRLQTRMARKGRRIRLRYWLGLWRPKG